MRDDEVAELMRRSDPAGELRDVRTEAEIAEDLRAITATTGASPLPMSARRRGWAFVAIAAVVGAVTALAGLVQIWSPYTGPAAAATPPLLELAPTTHTVGEVIDHALARLDAAPVEAAQRHASSEGWYLQTQVDDQHTSRSVITPQIQEVVWNDDLSGTVTLTAGEPYSPRDPAGAPPGELPSAPGTVLSHDEFSAGQMPVLFSEPPPTTTEQLRPYLATAAALSPDTADAVDYLGAVRALLSEWTLGPAGHAALLRILADTGGLAVAGDVTDRLGRPGTALRAISPDSPHFEYLIVISRGTGKIIALEIVYIGGLPDFAVPAPSVIDYTAWR